MSFAPSLESVAEALVPSGKGILADDESFPTIGKGFAALGIPTTEETRRAYRELLFTAPHLGECISVAILFDETIRQYSSGGVPFPDVLGQQGVITGIKVDTGTIGLAKFPGRESHQRTRWAAGTTPGVSRTGARFAKWRAVIAIGEGLPTPNCVAANAQILSLYAAVSQEAGLAPIVEPEVLMDGNHTFLAARFSGVERHRRRLAKVAALEHGVAKDVS